MKTILITGGGGFIGSNLAADLIARGTHRVVVCDRFGSDEKWRNLTTYPLWEIVPPEQLFAWLEKNHAQLEAIFHLGGIASTTEKDIDLILANNLQLSTALWEWANAHGTRFIYNSSSATYGNANEGFDDNIALSNLQRLEPMSGYGWSKHLFDMRVAQEVAAGTVKAPQWVGLKVFNAYGPNEYHKESQMSVICQIGRQAVHGGSVRLFRSYNPKYADGGQLRDVIYVKDCVAVMLWLLDHPEVSGLFNLGSGKARTFNDMATAVFAALGRPPKIHYIDMPETLAPIYQYFTEAKMDRLRAAGYTAPFTPVEEGVRDFITNYLAKDNPYR